MKIMEHVEARFLWVHGACGSGILVGRSMCDWCSMPPMQHVWLMQHVQLMQLVYVTGVQARERSVRIRFNKI